MKIVGIFIITCKRVEPVFENHDQRVACGKQEQMRLIDFHL